MAMFQATLGKFHAQVLARNRLDYEFSFQSVHLTTVRTVYTHEQQKYLYVQGKTEISYHQMRYFRFLH